MKNSKSSVLIIVLVLVLAVGLVYVFQSRNSAPDQVVYEPVQEESAVLDQVEDTAVPYVEESTLAPTVEEQASTEMVVPTERVGLQATDPATVQLASGQLQLIEAFAFW